MQHHSKEQCAMVQRGHKNCSTKRKRLEHQCRKTQLTVHRDMLTCQRNKVNTMCAEAKKTYYNEKLSDIRSHAQFYNIGNKLLHRRKTITLSNYECAESLANKFADYFDEKIQRIRTTLSYRPISNMSFPLLWQTG